MTLKNNYKLHILDSCLRTMDVLSAYTLKELAKLFCVYCQSHQEASYIMLYNGNENLTCKTEYIQWRKLYKKIFSIERRKKTINKDFEC